ncbi:DNA primase family protein [Desulfobaculum bizertense]|uniref:Putative DNA primase/helicase n=1 Tax=Desulfobaculum bizertense DSM 18034 TaxID=1121442 RepID=A0A1T4X3I6_9BACT|nr:phage/plasmid primase, P4 family [Desulfobaculum bizertense]SKA84116.1 putative DNA primase/helicase [Desulfobaculum bizertense DSM 18034]
MSTQENQSLAGFSLCEDGDNVMQLSEIREMVEARAKAEQGTRKNTAPRNLNVMECVMAEDVGLGELYAKIQRGRFVFNRQSREWMEFNGVHWQLDTMERSKTRVADVVSVLLKEAQKVGVQASEAMRDGNEEIAKMYESQQKTIMNRVRRLRRKGGPEACLEFAQIQEDPLAIKGDEIDQEQWLLACKNGVIDLQTGEFRDGKPEDFILKASTVRWEGIDCPAPNWEKFLLEIMSDDAEMVDYLRRLFGSTLRGGDKEHILPMFFGDGRNGKTVLVEMVSEVLGSLVGPIPSEMLLDQGMQRSADAPSPSVMSLRGLRAVFASETDEGRRFSASRCKWYSGGDHLVGRWPNDKRPITFPPTHTLFLLTNHKPHAPSSDFAFWDRLQVVFFERRFVKGEPQKPNELPRDPNLKDKLRQELPGILAWLVRGCLEWQQDGVNPPPKVLAATDEYRRDEDLLSIFIDECCLTVEPDEKDPTTRVNATEFYDAFVKWYGQNISKKKNFPQRKFGKLAQEKFPKRKVGGKNWYYGVLLSPDFKSEMGLFGKSDD